MSHEQLKITLKRTTNVLVSILLGLTFLALFSYISQFVSAKAPNPTATIQPQETISPTPTVSVIQPTVTPVVSDYRTILLLERAADLMVTYIDKVQAGEISIDDASARQPYTLAFSVAVDAYNHTTPSTGMEHGWKNVTMVATAYNQVYPILLQGKMISSNDLLNLKYSRQWLTNYQNTEESILTRSGKGSDYFAAERQAIEQLLQENYGDTPLPTPVP
jgi:hypothetical protein